MKYLFLLLLLLAGCGESRVKELEDRIAEVTVAAESTKAAAETKVADARSQVVEAKAKLAEAQASLDAEIEQKRLAAAERRRERIESVISIVTWVCAVLGFLATFGLILSVFFTLPIPKGIFIAVIAASGITLAVGQSFGAMLGLLPLVGLVLILAYIVFTAILLLSRHAKAAASIATYSDKLEAAILGRLVALKAPDHIIKDIDLLVDEIKATIHNDQIDNGVHTIVQTIRNKL
jgi:hypothetical protein